MPSTAPSATEFLRQASKTARHFGFTHLDDLKARPECASCADRVEHKAGAMDRRLDALHGMLASGACTYFENRLNGIEGPALFYMTDTVPRTGETALSLHIMNVEKSIAEALLIQTVHALLAELGYQNHVVRINSIGDTESAARYIRELTNYLKKRMDELPTTARELMKEHVFAALMYLIDKEHELAQRSPNSLEYLSDQSRKHFRDIIEYLDMSAVPYEIDPHLIGHQQCYSDALFAFDVLDDERNTPEQQPILVRGGRYNTFVERMSRRRVAAAGAVIVLRDRKAPSRLPRPETGRAPSIFVVQLGFGPKVKSLMLIDELRRAGIAVLQDIVSDSLTDQLRKAEAYQARYAIIIGQKEYVEGNVILRDLSARSQENVPVPSLISHLKRIVRA